MKNANRLMMLMILLLAPSIVFRAQTQQAGQETPKPPIPNYLELSPRIGTGGQPTEDGMRLIADKGYKIIINIRSSSEPFDIGAEEKQALQLGLRYYMVPFVANQPSEEQALAFVALMSALKDNRVFVHCGSGVRVGTLMMIYLALEEGMAPDKAEQEAEKIGLRAGSLLDFAKRVIAAHKK
jgi:protein tyrosine phosphatase (PTP) superfamily phosphohydrolase (DUF442 family)